MIIDPEKVQAVIAEIAEEEIMSRFGALGEHDIHTKSGPQDFVTAADRAAEARLEKALLGLYPGAAFIGEEGAAADENLVTRLDHERGAFWIVDPLDGTRNFVEGRREFGAIVALIENGEIRQGWIYAIPDRACAIGSKGDGASWRGEKLGPVSAASNPPVGYRATNSLDHAWKDRILPVLREKFETGPARCSAYAYINLVRGERDFAVYSRVYPWDHAAGILMLRELGGKAAYLDDESDYAPRLTVGRPLLAAGSSNSWETVRKTLAD
ncbi:inositol monophosphatase family protein [Hyphococcus sp.]|uniref:inositol monophosphatase family protein n=1 Tax=Hyphococcus sp. TaxID=2038636 RepID=UPI0020838034|nr:MAG: inositol phosphatase [Marinicaulis sp.]